MGAIRQGGYFTRKSRASLTYPRSFLTLIKKNETKKEPKNDSNHDLKRNAQTPLKDKGFQRFETKNDTF